MSYLPFVSVLIPVRNEEKYIDNCLNSIMKGDYPKEYFEIIVIDGMSNDTTKDKIIYWSAKHENILLLDNPKKIVTTALNLGIKNARGEIVVRIDAHAEYASDYISKCVEWLKKTGAASVGGAQRAVSRKGFFIAEALAFVNNSRFGLGGARFRDPNYEGYVKSVWLGAFRKEVLSKVGGFTEALYRSEDIELNYRIRKAGYKIFMTPEIKSYYYSRDTLLGMIKRCFLDGIGVIQTLFLNKGALSLRHFVPLLFVGSLLMSGMLSLVSSQFGTEKLFALCFLLFALVVVSYAIANIFFSALLSIKNGSKYFFVLPIIFATLHFSYGLGSAWGLLTLRKWIVKNR